MADHATATQRRAEDREQYITLQRLARLAEKAPQDLEIQELRELEFHPDARVAAIAADERVRRLSSRSKDAEKRPTPE